jgi:gluconolactonase
MVIDQKGYLFATGPGGVFVISPKGDVLGRIKTGKGSANCTFGEDGSTLFITNHDRLVKIPTLTRGLAWGS